MGPNRFPHPPHTLLLYISSSPLPISPRVPVYWPTSLTHWTICLDLHTETHTLTSLCYLKCISLYIVCLEALENPSSHCPKRRPHQVKPSAYAFRPGSQITLQYKTDLCLKIATVTIFKLAFESSIRVLWTSWCFLGSYWVIWSQ